MPLVFKRYLNEKTVIIVPPSAETTVIQVWPYSAGNSWAKVAVEAPKHVPVHRREILEEIAKFGNMHSVSPTKEEAAVIIQQTAASPCPS